MAPELNLVRYFGVKSNLIAVAAEVAAVDSSATFGRMPACRLVAEGLARLRRGALVGLAVEEASARPEQWLALCSRPPFSR